MQSHAARPAAQQRGGKGVTEPDEVRGEPPQDAKAASPRGALVPLERHLTNAPAQAVRLHQQLDAVRETSIRLERDGADDPAREEPQAVGRVVRREAGNVVKDEGRGTND